MRNFPLFLAFKYLRPKRSFVSIVTFISILGVVLGVAILIIVQSVMSGFDNMWRDKILSFKPHITVSSVYGTISNPYEVCDQIKEVEGVTGVCPAIQTRVLMQANDRTVAPIVLGLDPDMASEISMISSNMVFGSFDINGNNFVAGESLVNSLLMNADEKALLYSALNVVNADEIYLPEEVKLAGVFDMGMHDYDSGFILTSLMVGRNLVGLEEGAYTIYVMTDDAFKFSQYRREIARKLGTEYTVRTWRQVDSMLFQALSHEKTMMFILLVFIAIVAVFCVTNTLIVVTVQKTNEIGLLKALGFPTYKIMGAFIWLGMIQCIIGTILGVAAGFLVLVNLPNIVTFLTKFNVEVFPAEIYNLSEIPWATSSHDIILITGFVIVFCAISSILPSWRAAKLNPVEALRQE